MGDERRIMLRDWTYYWFESLIGWPIFEGDTDDEDFCRAGAINAAARAAGDWDWALIGDADTVQMPEGLEAARALGDPFSIPWDHRIKLSQPATQKFGREGPYVISDHDRDRRDGTSPRGGGATVFVSREAFETVGGFDESFKGYGNEDLAFVAAIETLVLGRGVAHLPGKVLHLYHPPRRFVGTRRAATVPNQERWDRYKAAAWNPEEMRALIDSKVPA